jgi:hypothetical protein
MYVVNQLKMGNKDYLESFPTNLHHHLILVIYFFITSINIKLTSHISP